MAEDVEQQRDSGEHEHGNDKRVAEVHIGDLPSSPVMTNESKRTAGWIANALISSVLVGNPAPAVRARYERMSTPRPGDLIFEASTWPRLAHDADLTNPAWDGQFVRLIRSGREYWYTDDDGVDHDEMVWVCANPDGTEFWWTNASIWAMPDQPVWGT